MENPRLIKKRVKSIKNIYKISKALEMVAASKVQKSQDRAFAAKPFAQSIYNLLQNFDTKSYKNIPLLRNPQSVSSSLFVIVSTNRGLCGSLNTNLLKTLNTFLDDRKGSKNYFVTVGKKARNFTLMKGELVADFSENSNSYLSVSPVTELLSDMFIKETVDEVYLIYNDFVSALVQKPVIKRILPISSDFDTTNKKTIYNFDPNSEEVLADLLVLYLENQVRECFSEGEASEHASRMVAMKNASENAHDLSGALDIEYNNARQQSITNELSDIVTATLTLS